MMPPPDVFDADLAGIEGTLRSSVPEVIRKRIGVSRNGFLGNRRREQKLARCRQLLGMPPCEPAALEAAKDYRDRYEELTGNSLQECPACHHGRMVIVATLPPGFHCHTAITDTS